MTKYEEAYKRLSAKEHHYHDIESVYADLKILGELVERDTPKPLDYEGDGYVDRQLNFDTAICRSCGRKFEVDYNEHSKHCPKCGQRLDWGENSE